MGRLTIDIPDSTHHHLRVMAAQWGITIREYVLEKILPELDASPSSEPSLQDLAAKWENRRKDFKLDRGERSWSDVTHEGHRW